MDKPLWIDRILSDTPSRNSFSEELLKLSDLAVTEMKKWVNEGNMLKAAGASGKEEGVRSVLRQLEMYEKEEIDQKRFINRTKGE